MHKIIMILLILLGYIFGSIPWALIIGKAFYKKDIREYGSHNLGGSNAIRTLGLIPGVCVIILDSCKALLFTFIVSLYDVNLIPICGAFVCIGHCYPLFAKFKGGKAVACSLGYVLGINIFIEQQYLYGIIIPCVVFAIVLVLSRYMSLSSMLSITAANIIGLFIYKTPDVKILICILNIFVVIKHRANIKRIIDGNENKIF